MDNSQVIKELVKSLSTKRVQNYAYLAAFLIVFSIFIFGAIKPSLTTAFSLKREEADLKKLDAAYEETIRRVVQIQSNIESIRDDVYLFEQAIPQKPQVNKLVKDIEDVGTTNTLTFKKVSVGEVNLVKKGTETVKMLPIGVDASSSFDKIYAFVKDVSNQRRLKVLNSLNLSKDESEATGSAGALKVVIDLHGFYL